MTHMRTQDGASASPMKGKTVLFTGASRGMGRFAAIELARRGAEVLVVGHNDARGAATIDAMRGTGGSAQFLHADMGDAEDVCALAEAVLARGGSIDVLIHSAGGLPPSAARTHEGVDRGFAQNFLGAFLLTRLLEERLLATVSMVGFTRLTVTTTGADVQLWLILRGLGLFIQALQTLSVSVVSKAQMARATSLRNSTTTVFSAVGVAVLTSYLTGQATTHLKDATATCVAQVGQHLAALHACVGQQSLTLGMNDTFFFALIACAICAVATLFVGRDPALEEARAAKKRGEKGEESAPMTVTP